ncbi:MAG: hypothetical protein P9L92_16815 [Candidatus Electryonea clarkiae]|nr:hypothetical protein [Candidatus Electryonea clarkiae]MDP8287926.1 hypothetical protein [Candidatus Electryonea clarkiae]
MKTRITMILFISILLLSNLYAEDNDTRLQARIDSLETRLAGIYMEQVDNNPYASGETRNWGSGYFVGAKAGANYTMNIEIGYMLKIKKNPLASLSREYIGGKTSYRLGLSAGMLMFMDEPVFKNDSTFYISNGYGPYGKINFGSPVLLNFISFAWHLKFMHTIPTTENDHNITEARMAYGYGNDIEFWLTENAVASIGFTDERDSMFGENKDDPIYPPKVRFVFGFKTFF